MTFVLGLNLSHISSACLLKDGRIVALASEERFNRVKNSAAFPKQSIAFVLDQAGIRMSEVDLLTYAFGAFSDYNLRDTGHDAYLYMLKPGRVDRLVGSVVATFPSFGIPLRAAADWWLRNHVPVASVRRHIAAQYGYDPERCIRVEHHECHAAATYYGVARKFIGDRQCLVMTHDGEGDLLCGSVSLSNEGKLKRMCVVKGSNSLALLYGAVTYYLGMKPVEHEYKVMGLAPYASSYEAKKALAGLEWMIGLDEAGLKFKAKFGYRGMVASLDKALSGCRFDGVAGGVQRLTESLLSQWVDNWVGAAGIEDVALGGGVFLNVKANKVIMELPSVRGLYVCPSPGDESNAIGAAYLGYRELCESQGASPHLEPLNDLYMGPEYSAEEIQASLNRNRCEENYCIAVFDDPEEEVAQLLSRGAIVARLSGRMEWGARALGSRSILADPSNPEVVRRINEQIKARDFWMPFAPTILCEMQHEYIVNLKEVEAPFMVLSFDSTARARKELVAALHPYDYTCRPQILRREHNEPYYRLVKCFQDITGIGAVLNTSFNLHGEPIVCTPDDAIETFRRSGLDYLVMGPFLLSKSEVSR